MPPVFASVVPRRTILAGGVLAASIPYCTYTAHASEGVPIAPTLEVLSKRFPPLYPQFQIALEVLAETGETFEIGEGPNGGRRIVPLVGGRFRGPGLSGVVLPGGADRQTVRADGVRELDAIYELEADDGTVLMVRNRALVDGVNPPEGESRYVRSVVQVTAPKGPHDWLNRRILIGTLHSLRPKEPFVFLRFYVLD